MQSTTKYGLGAVASLLITALVSAAGLCCCSGLLVIPNASTLGDGQYSYEYQHDGVIQGITVDTRLFNNEIGISDRLELGADVDLDDDAQSQVIGNCKYLAYTSGSGRLAASVGVCGLADHLKCSPYIVASQGLGACNLHLGTMRIEGSNRCIAGIDHTIGKLTLMGDYTSGDDGLSSLGFSYQFRDSFGIMAGALLPRGGEDTGFTLHFVWSEPFRKGRG